MALTEPRSQTFWGEISGYRGDPETLERLAHDSIQKAFQIAAEYVLTLPANVTREEVAAALRTARIAAVSLPVAGSDVDG